jgi:NNP family nitrate/nitrite transporter-like MFS transporter
VQTAAVIAKATDQSRAFQALVASTLAFTVCFAIWTLNGVLVTFLVDRAVYQWDRAAIGWLIGAPVLTGAILRLPVGLLTDRYGGRIVFPLVMLAAAVPMYLLSYADSYPEFLVASLAFGLSGASFAVGVAYTSLWFPPQQQGTALGIFGMGNMGAGLTVMVAPLLLRLLTDDGADLAGWRLLPRLYAGILVVTAGLFWLMTSTRKSSQTLSLAQRLAPLRSVRVWRFGLYYFFVFGSFVALSQWLVLYYVNVYLLPLAAAGFLAALYSLPAGVVRALGGWASDKWGARTVLYIVFSGSIILLLLLFPPRMEILAPGQGIVADQAGVVTEVTERQVVVGHDRYVLAQASTDPLRIRFGIHAPADEEGFVPLPATQSSLVPVVKVGDTVAKGQLLARGETHLYFQANRWIFAGLVLLLGLLMGIGSAAVYKHIPDYFPASVGAVGGFVGVIGALGGFFNPIVFGYLLQGTGVWTTCWMFLFLVVVICLGWMHLVVRRIRPAQVPVPVRQIEELPASR